MQVTVEALNGLQRKVIVKVPAEGIEQEINKRIDNLINRAKIPGFRSGKVPPQMVRERFGTSVRSEVISEVLQSTYHQAIQKEKLIPAGMPAMQFINNTVGEPLEYEAVFEVYPSIQLKELENVVVEGYHVEITDKDVDDMIERLRKQLAEWIDVDRPAQKGDQLVIDFDGKIDGAAFEGGSGKQAVIELGTNSTIPGFEDGLIGAKAKEERKLDLVFPDNYFRKELAGKRVLINVKVFKVSEAKLPPLDEEFAKRFAVPEGGIEKLKLQVRQNMVADVDRLKKNHVRAQVLEKILALNPVELPRALVEGEASKIKEQAEQQLGKSGNPATIPPKEQFFQLATQRVSLGLLFGEFIRLHQIKVDDSRVQTMLEQIAASYQDPQNVIAWYRGNKEQLAGVESVVLEEQVVEELMKQAKVEEKSISYLELMERSKNQQQ